MKKTLMILLAQMALVVVCAQEVGAQHINSDVILNFGAVAPRIPAEGIPIEGGTFVVAVGANTDWYVSEVSDFCTVRATGKQFEVSVEPNRSSTKRTIYVVLSTLSGGVSRKWAQTQAGAIDPPGTTIINGIKVAGTNVSETPGVFCEKPTDYGGYYTWEQALTACPTGWRLPTQSDFATIFGQSASINNRSMSWGSNGWTRNSSTGAATHTSGLFLPAAGYKKSNDTLNGSRSRGYYWSSTEFSSNTSRARNLRFYPCYVSPQSNLSKTNQSTVRCVQ